MYKTCLLVMACIAVSADRLRAAPPAMSRGAVGQNERDESAELAVKRALESPIGAVEFHRMPLGDFLEHLRVTAGVGMVVRWPALNRIGVFSDSLVTLTLQSSTVSAALEQGLAQADCGHRGATFSLRDGVVVVSSAEDLAQEMEIRTYDVRALLSARLSQREQVELQEAVSSLWKEHYQVFSPPWHRQPRRWGPEGLHSARIDPSKPAQERETDSLVDQMESVLTTRRLERLIRVIERSVFPTSWRRQGGEASIEAFGGRLVIRQSPEAHQAIEQLIDELAGDVAARSDGGQS